ncbi:hypothetical protein [Streptomyces sp. MST-110588]|uniref:hypothetical protein n=1 Tax=Streptomyces sp. MST-110588 TaxID=2833628 RepID=UPI001F5C6A05|nr:hypothetical protein [Streptomyces sp. MST-110588]UNO43923.1 hypothetical protein KGS77_14400 [Streptomyces sp. MST-110588]
MYVAVHRNSTVQDHVALVEIDLAGELMIAAAAASEDRLSSDRIDEVLDVDAERVQTEAGPARRG